MRRARIHAAAGYTRRRFRILWAAAEILRFFLRFFLRRESFPEAFEALFDAGFRAEPAWEVEAPHLGKVGLRRPVGETVVRVDVAFAVVAQVAGDFHYFAVAHVFLRRGYR